MLQDGRTFGISVVYVPVVLRIDTVYLGCLCSGMAADIKETSAYNRICEPFRNAYMGTSVGCADL